MSDTIAAALTYHRGKAINMEFIMPPGLESIRNMKEDLEDLDETHRAIERLEKRIEAQAQRIALLQRDGADSEAAEHLRAGMCDSLRELIMHRALIVHAITYRQ